MKDTTVATRYAKSLLHLSIELNVLEVVLTDMKLIHSVCIANPELSAILRSPIIRSTKKLSIINELFGKDISTLTQKFVNLISKKSRQGFIQDIAAQFVTQYKKHKGITTALFISASTIDEPLRKRVLEMLKNSSRTEVEVHEEVKKDLIGGFVVRIGDAQFDASVLRQLRNLRRDFSGNPYIKEL